MNKSTAKALGQSIKHWERMRDNKRRASKSFSRDYSYSGSAALEWPSAPDCALCERFLLKNDSCDGCPVNEKTRRGRCDRAPYREALNAYRGHGIESKQFKAASQKMIDFLISLRDQK